MKLTIVGDIFPGDEDFTLGYGIKSLFSNNEVRFLWQKNIQSIIGDSECVIGNLEGPLIKPTDAAKSSFWGHIQFADFLKKCGFTVLNIANNHILEHGKKGFESTLHCLENSEITAIGKEKDNIALIEKAGIKIAITGFCDKSICSIPHVEGTYNEFEESKVFETVSLMKNMQADIYAVVFHWGNEYIDFPSVKQRQLAHQLVDVGVDLIIGSHSHCIQPYEKYGKGHIFYSLGNFCFDFLQSNMVKNGMAATLTITKKGIEEVKLIGIDLYDTIYSNLLLKITNPIIFNNYYTSIDKKYRELQFFRDDKYEEIYTKILKKNKQREKLNMRKWIVSAILKAPLLYKRMLLKNIWMYYHNK